MANNNPAKLARAMANKVIRNIFNRDYADRAYQDSAIPCTKTDCGDSLMGKIDPAVAGNLVIQTAGGELIDAGVAPFSLANTILVDAGGSGDFATLAAAVTGASSGDVIWLLSDTTEGSSITTSKSLHIMAGTRSINASSVTLTVQAGGFLQIWGGTWLYQLITADGAMLFSGQSRIQGGLTNTLAIGATGSMLLRDDAFVLGTGLGAAAIDVAAGGLLEVFGMGTAITVSGIAKNCISVSGTLRMRGTRVEGISNTTPIIFQAGANLALSRVSYIHCLTAGGSTPASLDSVAVWNPADIFTCRFEDALGANVTPFAGANNILV